MPEPGGSIRLVWSQPTVRPPVLPPCSQQLLDDITALLRGNAAIGGSPMTGRRKEVASLDLDARLARHDQRLDDHEKRLSAIEQQTQEYSYEFDILARLALRNARRLDRIDRAAHKRSRK